MTDNFERLAKRYAQALLMVIEDSANGSQLESLLHDAAELLEKVSTAIQGDEQTTKFFENPLTPSKHKQLVVSKLVQELSMPKVTGSFMRLLAQKDRFSLLPYIATSFKELVDVRQGLVRIEVVTATSISDGNRQELEKIISRNITVSKNIKPTAVFSYSVDSSIIGGILVSFGDRILDGSLKTKLAKLENYLLNS